MTEHEYWFARRFPVGHARAGMAPVHWKGYAVVAIFVTVLVVGGVAFAYLGATDRMAEGVAVFVLAAFLGAMFYITVARQKGDRVRTIADYRREKRSA
jgi:ABC-type Co2+ transport system permease subunit